MTDFPNIATGPVPRYRKRAEGDPVAEAGARARLAAKRGKPMRPSTRQIGGLVKSIAPKAYRTGGGVEAIAARWREIAGDQLAKVSLPTKLSSHQGVEALTVTCLPAAAPILSHETSRLISAIKRVTGNRVSRIRIAQGRLPEAVTARGKRPRPKPVPPSVRAELEARVADVSDDKLRGALLRLGLAVHARNQSR